MAESNTPPAQGVEQPKQTSILVVEDDIFLRNLIIKKLMNENYVIWDATDGTSALKVLETKKPHLILLDILLPGIDGFEVLSLLKKNSELAQIPVIILSNLGSQDDIEKAMKLGATDYIIKANFTLEEIAERIKKILGEKYF
ncbi:MAG: hypothetical protein A3G49_02895 [Candidatus Sungbacteria bacterium RIFCSPLOWO2_12_FULL_41_11]|uniref:Response regulatory domain-containing protein n=1 Tax=Candidatus Sungbacteria bacterium RIFCSPLOWO2_12_FULL_41_11 TaxID=1802286 RepID=A0A1G2LTI0_9BACT|nr:MAG: Two component transcriptional regulator, winged helix family [Parcubacteria group bacterium GW2011_GWA2_42_14]OGZ98832.1 MAG: hypothetical protein A3D41_02220 [Candidatus Sungbacteria bacterium RIFCSPHIGHO2_02_FULL_41_12b]OHA14162.1 MAG: hypothetical protein A3G49_02895 [Candidatus Sungbacteria bacterium RIFCSPLOWO2_12_FULL_41_11]